MAQATAAGAVALPTCLVRSDTVMKLANGLVVRLAVVMMVLALFAVASSSACAGAQNAPPAGSGETGTDSPTAGAMPEQEPDDPRVSDGHVLFGQSAAFTGPAGNLGNAMRLGIEAAFHEANQDGGVHGRTLELEALNDSYETDFALSNTHNLIEKSGVFALVGAVGTPTSRVAAPVADAAGVPFIAPFTGAELLRNPELETVINLRSSYYQETEEMVARLTEDLGITRIAVFYQDDSFGQNGLEGTRQALQRRDLEPVALWHYPRNTIAVKAATLKIAESEPEAVIMIGSYAPVARAIELLRRDVDPIFMAVSFVGSNALAEELGNETEDVYVTQVVPLPYDANIPVVARYHAALAEYDSEAEPGFISLEGYLAGRLAVAGLEACGRELSRQCFLNALRDAAAIDIDGIRLKYGPGDNQGSDAVFLTAIGADGQYRQIDNLGGDSGG